MRMSASTLVKVIFIFYLERSSFFI